MAGARPFTAAVVAIGSVFVDRDPALTRRARFRRRHGTRTGSRGIGGRQVVLRRRRLRLHVARFFRESGRRCAQRESERQAKDDCFVQHDVLVRFLMRVDSTVEPSPGFPSCSGPTSCGQDCILVMTCGPAVAKTSAPWDRSPMPSAPPAAPSPHDSSLAAFAHGVLTAWRSVFAYVLFGTYIGIGALAHDFGFSVGWMMLSTVLIWAAPAQVILISTLGSAAL